MCKQAGAKEIFVAVTHAMLCGPAIKNLSEAPITKMICTDTIPMKPEQMLPKFEVLSVAHLLGEGIKRIHSNESVSTLFK